MEFCRALSNVQLLRNLLVCEVPEKKLEHLTFPCCQCLTCQKLPIEQCLHLLDECQQHFGRHPKPAPEHNEGRFWKFRLPLLAQSHETVDSPMKQEHHLAFPASFGGKKGQEFAA